MLHSTPILSTDSKGARRWTLNGKLHRADGPALEKEDGTNEWYANGELHRVDGPAVEYPDGTKVWYLNGKLHRAAGPAIEYADGTKEWHLNDEWHRTDGPAIEYCDGTVEWRLYGELHRIDGPAIEHPDGAKEWWANGKRHRADGPAIEGDDDTHLWYVNGEQISAPYSHVLTAVFNRGLPIPEEAMLEIGRATSEAQTSMKQISSLKIILDKHWPTQVHKILATLFSDSDPAIKHLAFSLLGRETQVERTQGPVGI